MAQRPTLYTISNGLSFYRLLASPVIVWAALSEHRTLFLWLAAISLGTDAVDGIIARWRREETRLGARLDALADSLTLGAGLTGVWVFERAPFVDNPKWLLMFLGALALATLTTLVKFGRLPAFHLYSFKIADIFLTAFFAAVFLIGFSPLAYAGSMSFATLAALEIVAVALVIDRFEPDLKGLWWVLRSRR